MPDSRHPAGNLPVPFVMPLPEKGVESLLGHDPLMIRRHVRYGADLYDAVKDTGVFWAEALTAAGYSPTSEGLDLMLQGLVLRTRQHLASHDERGRCPDPERPCHAVIGLMAAWADLLRHEVVLYNAMLRGAR